MARAKVPRGRKAAVFLDRDGVLVQLRGRPDSLRPPRSLKETALVDGAVDAVARLRRAGLRTVVISNQPDIARGKVDHRTVQEIHDVLRAHLHVDAVYYCPHDNSDGCGCRKPKPGMILQGASEWRIDLSRSCLVGDRWVDLAAANAAGVDGILLQADHTWKPTSSGPPPSHIPVRFAARSLTECVDFILSSGRYGFGTAFSEVDLRGRS